MKIKKITQTAVINIVFQRIFIKLGVSYASQHTFSKSFSIIFKVKLRWPKNKSLLNEDVMHANRSCKIEVR